MSTRSYADAIQCLNTLQSNASALKDATPLTPEQQLANRERKLDLVSEYLSRIGYSPSDLNKLNVIHVTGTKDKGSTCAIVDSVLRHVRPSWRIGLYTSPHLVAVRERIRINGVPLSEELFSTYFFEVWDRLGSNDKRADLAVPLRPMYFRFLTLVAFHAFISLKIDATILEVGIGGLHDDTNIIPRPIVTGITSIGYDHMGVLGTTLKDIAFQKGGIFKAGVPAFTVDQPNEAMASLEDQAKVRQASSLEVIKPPKEYYDIPIGLEGAHQVQNAALAVKLATSFLTHRDPGHETDAVAFRDAVFRGLKLAKWPGRCQQVNDPQFSSLVWFLDGAHTSESLKCCMEWYVGPDTALRPSSGDNNPRRVLIFNCTKGRTGHAFLDMMLSTTSTQLRLNESSTPLESFFTDVIFCANVTYIDGHFKGDLLSVNLDTTPSKLEIQNELAAAWSSLLQSFPPERIHVLASIEHAVRVVQSLSSAQTVQVLVTGSLHLVGGLIEVAGLSKVAL